jgi:hypothetical protein
MTEPFGHNDLIAGWWIWAAFQPLAWDCLTGLALTHRIEFNAIFLETTP